MRKFAILAFLAMGSYFGPAETSYLQSTTVTEFPQKEVKAIADSENKFTRDLYVALSRKDGNLFFSPFSISTALAMVYMGSEGRTESQMQSVMHLPSNKSSTRKAFHDLMTNYKKNVSEYELRSSNMVYISNLLSISDDYVATLTHDFLSSSKLVDFSNPEPVREEINSAVEKETNSKIKDVISPNLLNALTRMVLVNAIYFKGSWVHQFNPFLTQRKPFWVTANVSVHVPMMDIDDGFKLERRNELNATLLALDYKGDRLSLMILLPDERDGLAALEEKLALVDFRTLDIKPNTERRVIVQIPKFKLEEGLDLNPVLESMGMTDVFSPSLSNLSGISKEKLFVSNVVHKAFLEVNEQGTEAAAATGGLIRLSSSPPRFIADHPFFFFIRDRLTNVILFVGRFLKP